jgi:hypothetical protein
MLSGERYFEGNSQVRSPVFPNGDGSLRVRRMPGGYSTGDVDLDKYVVFTLNRRFLTSHFTVRDQNNACHVFLKLAANLSYYLCYHKSITIGINASSGVKIILL